MKICNLVTSFPRYKGDYFLIFVYEPCKRLANLHKVFIIAPNDARATRSSENIDKINVRRFNYFFPRSLHRLAYGSGMAENVKRSLLAKAQVIPFIISLFLKALKYTKRSDVIHTHFSPAGLTGVLLKKVCKKPLIFSSYRLVGSNRIMKRINRYIFENADYVTFISTYLRDKAKKIARLKSYSIIPLGVDHKLFNPGVKKFDFHKNFNIRKNHKIIFYAGRLVEKKGINYLLGAMPTVLKKQKNCTLIIGGEGAEEKNLKNLAENLKVRDNVRFIGKISHHKLPSYFKGADIFVLPSIVDSKGETETLGVVLIEAMACGTPVIGSRVGGIIDVIDNGINGFLVKQKSSKQLAEKIIKLLSNTALRERMGKQGRKKVEQKFSWDKIALEVNGIYANLVG